MQQRNEIIFSLHSEQVFGNFQHPFMTKIFERSGIQGIYLNTIKTISNNVTDKIQLNGEKIKTIQLKSGITQYITWTFC